MSDNPPAGVTTYQRLSVSFHFPLDGPGLDLGTIRIESAGKKYRVFFLREAENGGRIARVGWYRL
jgi:hypothetical protein